MDGLDADPFPEDRFCRQQSQVVGNQSFTQSKAGAIDSPDHLWSLWE